MFFHKHSETRITGFNIITIFLACLPWMAVAATGATLSLKEAEQIALDLDPMTKVFAARAEAYTEQAVAEGQLPDPKLKLGTVNVPVDSFDIEQEPIEFSGLRVSDCVDIPAWIDNLDRTHTTPAFAELIVTATSPLARVVLQIFSQRMPNFPK